MRFRFDQEVPVIVVTPTLTGINGKRKKVDMALDTGATYTMIPWEFAEVLGYKPEISKNRVKLITASGVEKAPAITLASMNLLGKKIDNVKTIVHDLPEKSYVDGLLGLSFLRNFEINIDFKDGILEIY
ncbi:retroviral aspartyl protease [archaeon]|nr:retroviral aspartyl protease [archaeon]